MDPDEVFNRFNNIIGPDFSLITGRRLNQAHIDCKGGSNTHGDTRRGEDLANPVSKTAPRERPGEVDRKNDEEVSEVQRPKELVYIKRDPASLTKVAQDECVLITDIEERATSIENEDVDGKAIHILRYVRAFHNGHCFGLTKHSIDIGSSSQEIVNLTAEGVGVIPMRLLPAPERQDIQTRLISRGKEYRKICERPYMFMQYEGPVIPLDQGTDWAWTTNQRVVIDGMAGRKMRGALGDNSFTASHLGQSLKAFLGTESHLMPHSDGPSSSQGGNLMSDDALPGAKGKQKSSEYEKTGENHEGTDIDYLTCPPTLVAFLLDDNIWANVHVKHLEDVAWPENPFDSLELEIGKKRLIQNITRRFKATEMSGGSNQDTGEGHGGDLIIFLTGPPGVGKTLTAELVAEETQRPLYRVSAGDLSVDPSALLKQLGDVFLIARRWGAIILIDEADMFITKRRASTSDQNAVVTAFLRLFHTYDGLLFLTSTSPDIDTAFYDRVHVTIKYIDLDETQRISIWRRQLQRAVRSPEGHPPSCRWPEEAYRLLGKVKTNGREIRNIVRTAEQLALGLSADLTMKHVAAAMRNFGGSDNDVESICEKLEVLEGQLGDDREQACDEDVELQHSIGERPDAL